MYHLLIFLLKENYFATKKGKFVYSKISGNSTALIINNRFLLVPLIAFKYNALYS